MGLSFFKLFVQNEPWVEERGYISLLGLVKRFCTNLADFSSIGAILTNNMGTGFFHRQPFAQLTSLLVTGVIFGVGLYVSASRRLSILPVYSVLYIAAVELYHPEIELRWLLPVLPFLFYYILEGLECLWAKLPSACSSLCRWAAVIYAACYLGYGVNHMVTRFPAEHQSPFGSFPIKYPANYDEQRLAMWMREHVPQESVYVCQHPLIMDLLTQRTGFAFPLSRDPNQLLDLLSEKKAKYLLISTTNIGVQQFLLPVIARQPRKFHLIRQEQTASLYEVAL
jgi:hypothetical protein